MNKGAKWIRILLAVVLSINIWIPATGIVGPKDVVSYAEGDIPTGDVETNPTECICEISLSGVEDKSSDIGTCTFYELYLSTLGITAEYKNEGCVLHPEGASAEVTFAFDGETVGGKGEISEDKLLITEIGAEAVVPIKVTAAKNDVSISEVFTVTVTRTMDAPVITEYAYDRGAKKINLKVNPSGHESVDVYINDENAGKIIFAEENGYYVDGEWSVAYADTKRPEQVSEITAVRDPGNTSQALITWTAAEDGDDIVTVYCRDGEVKSNDVQMNIKDDSPTYEIYLSSLPDQKHESDTAALSIPIADLTWGCNVSVNAVDDAGNTSGLTVLAVPDDVIYSTAVTDDSMTVKEGGTGYSDVISNDTHDPLYPVPKLMHVEILDGKPGKVMTVSGESMGVVNAAGLLVHYTSVDGMFGDLQIKYTYDKVRDDIPAASGVVNVTVAQRNKEPAAVDDGEEVTAVLSAQSGMPFEIPCSLLLANDTDRETPESLRITKVGNCTMGTAELHGDVIKVTPEDEYYGYMTFEYGISDGELSSLNKAKVTIYVKNVPKPPEAFDVETKFRITEKEKTIGLNVSDPNNTGYLLDGDLKIYRNEEIVDSSIMIATIAYGEVDTNGNAKQYVQVTLNDNTQVSLGDELIIPYTVSNSTGSATANIRITITEGEDTESREGYLYVHRKPVASASVTVTKDPGGSYIRKVTIGSGQEISYDLDHEAMHASSKTETTNAAVQSRQRPYYSWKGIRTWEWSIKTNRSTTWTIQQFDAEDYMSAQKARTEGLNWLNSQAVSLLSSGYITEVSVALRVRDIDGSDHMGVWSDRTVILVTSMPLKPLAMFSPDKSTYLIPASATASERAKLINIRDNSYDPNGDGIKRWDWKLTLPTGVTKSFTYTKSGSSVYKDSKISEQVSNAVYNAVNASGYNPTTSECKLTLVVTEDTGVELKSDEYSVTFEVYKENAAPSISTNNSGPAGSLSSSTFYEKDDGADGYVGDDWGTSGNTVHKGKVDFSKMFTITDDQSVGNITLDWTFDGQSVAKRADYVEEGNFHIQKIYNGKKYSPFSAPFTGTVTDAGMRPGAYRITVAAKDKPAGNAYGEGAAATSYWRTFSNMKPYHLYVVPKLEMYMHTKVNGWIDMSYRESDGKTLEQLGLTVTDIAPTIGDTIEIYGSTNRYVTGMWVYEDTNGNEAYDNGENKIACVNTTTRLDGTREWSAKLTLDDTLGVTDSGGLAKVNLRVVGETNWGSETQKVMRTKEIPIEMKAMPVKLYDFRITGVTDPGAAGSLQQVISTLKNNGYKLTNGALTDGVPVGKLAVDVNTQTTGNGSPVRKGYGFYFKLNSRGLQSDDDEIQIIPRFYESFTEGAGEIRIGNELTGYVPDEKGVYCEYTGSGTSENINRLYGLFYEGERIHSLNTHADVRLGPELREVLTSEQVWSGRYGIPADAKFFRTGVNVSEANEFKGDILITFEIKACKNGKARYNYVERGQWEKERQAISDVLKNVYKIKESEWKSQNNYLGSIITYNGMGSIKDAYISNPIWRE